MDLNVILGLAVRSNASDIHLKAGLPPVLRVRGKLSSLKDAPRLSAEQIGRMAIAMMNPYHKERFKERLDVDLAYTVESAARFRVNIFQQRGIISVALRVIPSKISAIDELLLPQILERIAMEERGLVLVTGATGSGKSTTLAAMLQYINLNRSAHVITIEDPVEFQIRDHHCIVNQREVGTDVKDFTSGLRAALRQDPDVILIGEMRDRETIETALLAAETGHLVFSTLHTINAAETINRIISVFEPHQRDHMRRQIGGVLKAVLSQRLIPRKDRGGRVPAIEVLRTTARIKDMILDPERTRELPEALAAGASSYGMQTFDQSLMFLLKNNYISYEEAVRQCDNPDDFALRVSGITTAGTEHYQAFEEREDRAAAPAPDIERF
ncbi:MAG: PilT/PilU family type 4a pilus ATPase [Deltaproteobacteria bacterium]|nr:PilT/PilU family type 4a pilus ATPase [Deltaproteobacteria bacterium]